jgi:3-hydroxy-9,10-secoandrosta-1,3,5(10)-triene-9,17-dione monooxygenase
MVDIIHQRGKQGDTPPSGLQIELASGGGTFSHSGLLSAFPCPVLGSNVEIKSMATAKSQKSTITRDELLERARALVPFLAEKADETERSRTMLPEVQERLTEAGLFRIMQTPHLGGYGLDLTTHLAVAGELARGCGSTAWIQSLIGSQNSHIGWYPPETQEEVRATEAPLFVGLVMGPPEIAERVDGGVRLNGRWPYVSGADQATWLMLSARDPDDHARVLTCLLPQADGRIEDDWFAMGLRGTGSKSVFLDNLFVPDHRVLCFRETEQHGAPGAAVNPGSLYIGAPNSVIFAMVVAAPAIGLAACAIDAYKDRLKSRWSARMPSAQTEWPASQARLGRAKARWIVARESLLRNADALTTQIVQGEKVTVAHRTFYRMAVVEVVSQCTDIVYDLFCDAGTGAALDGSVLQRAFRDIHTLRSHFMIMPDIAAENTGRVELDMDPKPPYAGG